MSEHGMSAEEDREIRDSIRVMQNQRNTKLVAVVIGMILAVGALFAAVYFAYGDQPDAAKTPPAAR